MAPGLVVLVTSRTVLRLSGDYEFTVAPLPIPPAGATPDLADLQHRRGAAHRGPGRENTCPVRGGKPGPAARLRWNAANPGPV